MKKRFDEAERLQNLVCKLFVSTLNSREYKFRLSYPLIPRISKEYLRNRIVIVGQETNTWYDTGSKYGDYNDLFLNKKYEIEKESLCNRYDDFVNKHVRRYGGKFWGFNRLLYEKGIIEGDIVKDNELSHCWINIFSMEACRGKKDDSGRPTKNKSLRKVIINHQGMLIYHLLKIISPRLIIFLTGHSLDDVVCKYALNVECIEGNFEVIDPNNILEAKHACRIVSGNESSFSGTTILRLYHPSYFMGRINTYKSLRDKVVTQIGEEIVPYYQHVVFSFLKQWKNEHG